MSIDQNTYEYIPQIEHEKLLEPDTFHAIKDSIQTAVAQRPHSPVFAEGHGRGAIETGERAALERHRHSLTPELIEAVMYTDRGRQFLDDYLRPHKVVPGIALGHVFFKKSGHKIMVEGTLRLLDTEEIQVEFLYDAQEALTAGEKREFGLFANDLGLKPLWLACLAATQGKATMWRPRTYMNESMGRRLLHFLN